MAMEDGLVLAELLRSSACVEEGLDLFVTRRRPRVDWVQRASRAVGEMLHRPPDTRNAVLRRRGATALLERFRPLTPPP
jgi:FAD-dependent urate hydroxylase